MSGESPVAAHQSPEDLPAALFDLRAIFSLRAVLANLDPQGEPRAVVVARPRPPGLGRAAASVAILAGSFDPLTNAHIALARAALTLTDASGGSPQRWGAGGGHHEVYLALSRHTVNKEARVRPTDADRALTLRLWADQQRRCGVLLFNRGLYADQALAARAAFPAACAIRFIVGFDKARQIFDPRFYADRDTALRTLFANVSLLVAPRAGDGPDALAALLDRPENRPFRDAVRPLPLDAAWADDSSTTVRAAARDGRPFAHLVPPETVAFVNSLRPYAPPDSPDPYELREALIAALERERPWAASHADLRALIALALADDARGAALRPWLATPPAGRQPPTLRALLAQ